MQRLHVVSPVYSPPATGYPAQAMVLTRVKSNDPEERAARPGWGEVVFVVKASAKEDWKVWGTAVVSLDLAPQPLPGDALAPVTAEQRTRAMKVATDFVGYFASGKVAGAGTGPLDLADAQQDLKGTKKEQTFSRRSNKGTLWGANPEQSVRTVRVTGGTLMTVSVAVHSRHSSTKRGHVLAWIDPVMAQVLGQTEKTPTLSTDRLWTLLVMIPDSGKPACIGAEWGLVV